MGRTDKHDVEDDWIDDLGPDEDPLAQIYAPSGRAKKDSIDARKRRRIEAMQEERALQRSLRDWHDEDD